MGEEGVEAVGVDGGEVVERGEDNARGGEQVSEVWATQTRGECLPSPHLRGSLLIMLNVEPPRGRTTVVYVTVVCLNTIIIVQ